MILYSQFGFKMRIRGFGGFGCYMETDMNETSCMISWRLSHRAQKSVKSVEGESLSLPIDKPVVVNTGLVQSMTSQNH